MFNVGLEMARSRSHLFFKTYWYSALWWNSFELWRKLWFVSPHLPISNPTSYEFGWQIIFFMSTASFNIQCTFWRWLMNDLEGNCYTTISKCHSYFNLGSLHGFNKYNRKDGEVEFTRELSFIRSPIFSPIFYGFVWKYI